MYHTQPYLFEGFKGEWASVFVFEGCEYGCFIEFQGWSISYLFDYVFQVFFPFRQIFSFEFDE